MRTDLVLPNAHRIASSMGIKLHGRKATHKGYLRPKECHSPKAIFLVAKRGEKADDPERIYNVLHLILEADNECLFGDVIYAIDEWYSRHKIKQDEYPFLLDAFKKVPLMEYRNEVVRHNITHISQQLAFLVSVEMEDALLKIRNGVVS